jgi:hypothetical protein
MGGLRAAAFGATPPLTMGSVRDRSSPLSGPATTHCSLTTFSPAVLNRPRLSGRLTLALVGAGLHSLGPGHAHGRVGGTFCRTPRSPAVSVDPVGVPARLSSGLPSSPARAAARRESAGRSGRRVMPQHTQVCGAAATQECEASDILISASRYQDIDRSASGYRPVEIILLINTQYKNTQKKNTQYGMHSLKEGMGSTGGVWWRRKRRTGLWATPPYAPPLG